MQQSRVQAEIAASFAAPRKVWEKIASRRSLSSYGRPSGEKIAKGLRERWVQGTPCRCAPATAAEFAGELIS